VWHLNYFICTTKIYEFEKLYNNTQGTAFGRVASENILLAIRQTNCFASES